MVQGLRPFGAHPSYIPYSPTLSLTQSDDPRSFHPGAHHPAHHTQSSTMLAKMGRPRLPGVLQRDIRNSKPLRPTRSSDRSASHGLLPGWKEAKAPDGRTYYFHAESGETKWDKPAAEESSAGERPKKPTAALVVRAKPVIPGVAGLAKRRRMALWHRCARAALALRRAELY